MKEYKSTFRTFAIQLTPENIELVETICSGSIKGIRLDRSKQCIDFWYNNDEYRLEMGEWFIKDILEDGTVEKSIVLDKDFKRSYIEV